METANDFMTSALSGARSAIFGTTTAVINGLRPTFMQPSTTTGTTGDGDSDSDLRDALGAISTRELSAAGIRRRGRGDDGGEDGDRAELGELVSAAHAVDEEALVPYLETLYEHTFAPSVVQLLARQVTMGDRAADYILSARSPFPALHELFVTVRDERDEDEIGFAYGAAWTEFDDVLDNLEDFDQVRQGRAPPAGPGGTAAPAQHAMGLVLGMLEPGEASGATRLEVKRNVILPRTADSRLRTAANYLDEQEFQPSRRRTADTGDKSDKKGSKRKKKKDKKKDKAAKMGAAGAARSIHDPPPLNTYANDSDEEEGGALGMKPSESVFSQLSGWFSGFGTDADTDAVTALGPVDDDSDSF
jgi:hypothetical protein